MGKFWQWRMVWAAFLLSVCVSAQAAPPRKTKTAPPLPPVMSVVLSQPVVRVPIHVVEEEAAKGIILLMVDFGSGPIECQLDTGTFLVNWDDRYHFKGTSLGKSTTGYTASGALPSNEVVQIKTMTIGGAVFKNVPTFATDWKSLEHGDAANTPKLSRPLIGWSFFMDYAISIDYKAGTLLIGQPKAIRARLKSTYQVPLKYSPPLENVGMNKAMAPSIVAECQIAGMHFNALIDTGNPTEYTVVNASSWPKLRDRIIAQSGPDAIAADDSPAYPNDKACITDGIATSLFPKASKTYPTALCKVVNLPVGRDSPVSNANIGWGYLHHFIVTFDFASAILYLEEQKTDAQKP